MTVTDFAPIVYVKPATPPNVRAVVLTSPEEIGGKITAGSHVDVWVGSELHSKTGSHASLRRLYQDMYVLSVGSNGDAVTLWATPKQAGRIDHAMGRISDRLVLRLHS